MNKDLEMIKQQLQVGMVGVDWDGEFDDSAYREIIEAAERMAEQIAKLEAELVKTETLYMDAKNNSNELEAELAQRPEVVRCGECKKKGLGFTCPLICANAVIKAKTKIENFIEFDDNDFCSAGKRRESEVKDGKK